VLGIVLAVFGVTGPGGHADPPQEKKPVRLDQYDDPLPAGVLARMGSVRLDCQDSILSAVFAPDGKSLSVVTGAREKQLWLLDAATGKTIRRSSLPEGPRQHALTPDQRFLVLRTFYQKSIRPDQVGVTNFGEIHVLDAATLKPVWKTDPKQEFGSMALSADGKLLAGGTEPYAKKSDVYLWETATGKQLAVLKGHQLPATSLAFSADGKRLLSASDDVTKGLDQYTRGSVRVWELPGGKPVKQISPGGFGHVLSPNGKSMAFFDAGRMKVCLWDLDADREIAALPVATPFLFSPDGRHLVTGGRDRETGAATDMLRLWDPATGRQLRSFRGLVGNGTLPLAFSPDGKVLASRSASWGDHRIRLWDVAKGTELRPFGAHHGDISCLAFSADGKKLISGGKDQTARIWETASGKELTVHDRHEVPVTAVAFSADGRTVASGDRSNVTHVWDATTGKLLHRLRSELETPWGTHPAIRVLRFAPDGKTLWAGSAVFLVRQRRVVGETGELALYETVTGKRLRSLKREDSFPLAVSPDGALSVWAGKARPKRDQDLDGWQEKVSVRRTDTGRELFTIETGDKFRPNEVVDQVIFSPDGRLIAVNSHWLAESFTRNEDVPCYRIVEVASGRKIADHDSADFPWTLFTPDGRVLVGAHRVQRLLIPGCGSIREDRPAITVMDAIAKQAVGELPGHPLTTNPWAVAPHGRFFASANADHTILVWDLTRQDFKQPPGRKDATREELEQLWTGLGGEDAAKAFRAAAELAAVPAQSVPFLCQRLKPVAEPSAQAIAGHIKDLDSKQFEVRDRARAALEKLGELAEPALRQVLEGNPSLETRRRVERLLEELDRARLLPERLRAARAVAVLERGGTAEARKHLTVLAAGAPGAWLTREAKASLERLRAAAESK
jgi:WD40 repeat protein